MTTIAELGTGHGGSLERAYQLIDAAQESGADAVKFQWVYADEILHPKTGFVDLPGGKTPLFDVFKSLEVEPSFFEKCCDYSHLKGLKFVCSPFGIKSLTELLKIKVDAVKIASPELNHIPLLKEVAKTCQNIPVIISTGVSKLSDIETALEILKPVEDLTILHCITSYPAPESEYNLKLIKTYSSLFGVKTGVSDHSLDAVLVPVLSLAMGGSVIEKHFTLCHDDGGLDDKIALTPEEFAHMCYCVNQTKSLLKKFSDTPDLAVQEVYRQMAQIYGMEKVVEVAGTGKKILAVSEEKNYGRTNRSLHYRESFPKGYKLQPGDVLVLRTEKELTPGIHPQFLETVLGVELKTHVQSGEGVLWNHLLI